MRECEVSMTTWNSISDIFARGRYYLTLAYLCRVNDSLNLCWGHPIVV